MAAAKKTQFQKGLDKAKSLLKPNKSNGKKRRQPGIAGKVGAFLIGVVPVIVPVPGIISTAQARDKAGVSMGSNVEASLKGYINGLATGVGLGDVFSEMSFNNKDGSFRSKDNPGNGGVPRGSTWGVWITGFVYMAMDKAAQVLNSGKGQNIPGTRTRMIGSG